MPAYIVLYKWTPEDAVNMKEFLRRAEQASAVAEQMGARVVGGWITMGGYDMVVVYDAPG